MAFKSPITIFVGELVESRLTKELRVASLEVNPQTDYGHELREMYPPISSRMAVVREPELRRLTEDDVLS